MTRQREAADRWFDTLVVCLSLVLVTLVLWWIDANKHGPIGRPEAVRKPLVKNAK